MRWLVMLTLVACGNAATPAAPAPLNCYPYAERNGACLTRCDFYNEDGDDSTDARDDCAQNDWPLRCNSDGTCTPEPPPDSQ